jgi:hypothetical protein
VHVGIRRTVDDVDPTTSESANNACQIAVLNENSGSLFGMVLLENRKLEETECPKDEWKHQSHLQNNEKWVFSLYCTCKWYARRFWLDIGLKVGLVVGIVPIPD